MVKTKVIGAIFFTLGSFWPTERLLLPRPRSDTQDIAQDSSLGGALVGTRKKPELLEGLANRKPRPAPRFPRLGK